MVFPNIFKKFHLLFLVQFIFLSITIIIIFLSIKSLKLYSRFQCMMIWAISSIRSPTTKRRRTRSLLELEMIKMDAEENIANCIHMTYQGEIVQFHHFLLSKSSGNYNSIPPFSKVRKRKQQRSTDNTERIGKKTKTHNNIGLCCAGLGWAGAGEPNRANSSCGRNYSLGFLLSLSSWGPIPKVCLTASAAP